MDNLALISLACDGESLFGLARFPSLLWIVKRLTEHMFDSSSHMVCQFLWQIYNLDTGVWIIYAQNIVPTSSALP